MQRRFRHRIQLPRITASARERSCGVLILKNGSTRFCGELHAHIGESCRSDHPLCAYRGSAQNVVGIERQIAAPCGDHRVMARSARGNRNRHFGAFARAFNRLAHHIPRQERTIAGATDQPFRIADDFPWSIADPRECPASGPGKSAMPVREPLRSRNRRSRSDRHWR